MENRCVGHVTLPGVRGFTESACGEDLAMAIYECRLLSSIKNSFLLSKHPSSIAHRRS